MPHKKATCTLCCRVEVLTYRCSECTHHFRVHGSYRFDPHAGCHVFEPINTQLLKLLGTHVTQHGGRAHFRSDPPV